MKTVKIAMSCMIVLTTTTGMVIAAQNDAEQSDAKMKGQPASELDFDTRRQMMSDRASAQIENLNQFKTCVSGATDNDSLMQCNKLRRDTMMKKGQNKQSDRMRKKRKQRKTDANPTTD